MVFGERWAVRTAARLSNCRSGAFKPLGFHGTSFIFSRRFSFIFAYPTRLGALILFSTMSLCGCGGPDQGDFPETFDASGVVTFNGSAVSNAVVTLSPSDPEGRGASGRTNEAGKFTLTTFNPSDGAPSGTYRVKIVPSKLAPGVPSGDQEVVLDNPETDGVAPGTETELETLSDLPKKYADEETSGLGVQITEGQNTLDFNLSG